MVKIKDDVNLFFIYDTGDGIGTSYIEVPRIIKMIVQNNMEKDRRGYKILHYQFSLDRRPCELEDIYDDVVPKVGTYWNTGKKIIKIISDRELECPNFDRIQYCRFSVLYKDGYPDGLDWFWFEDYTQVANWEGDPLEEI